MSIRNAEQYLCGINKWQRAIVWNSSKGYCVFACSYIHSACTEWKEDTWQSQANAMQMTSSEPICININTRTTCTRFMHAKLTILLRIQSTLEIITIHPYAFGCAWNRKKSSNVLADSNERNSDTAWAWLACQRPWGWSSVKLAYHIIRRNESRNTQIQIKYLEPDLHLPSVLRHTGVQSSVLLSKRRQEYQDYSNGKSHSKSIIYEISHRNGDASYFERTNSCFSSKDSLSYISIWHVNSIILVEMFAAHKQCHLWIVNHLVTLC